MNNISSLQKLDYFNEIILILSKNFCKNSHHSKHILDAKYIISIMKGFMFWLCIGRLGLWWMLSCSTKNNGNVPNANTKEKQFNIKKTLQKNTVIFARTTTNSDM